MTDDFAEKERQFLAALKATSGRDLAEWMTAIKGEAPPGRNDIIDWLRQQGFPFTRASWLERIHENGGRPLYGQPAASRETPPSRKPRTSRAPEPPVAAKPAPVLRLVSSVPPAKPAPEAGPAPETKPAVAPPSAASALEPLLAKAKAYRPLAHFLLREIQKAVPGAVSAPRDAFVSIGAPAEFAALLASARDLRLGLALGEEPFGERFQKAKFGAGIALSPAITHMTTLTDARQVDAELMEFVRRAAARANG